EETGILLALGFTSRQVRQLFRREGILLAAIGGILGVLGGLGFARLMLLGLSTLWREAVNSAQLKLFIDEHTVVHGFFLSVIICAITITIVLRKQARQPARELLTSGSEGTIDPVARKSKAPLLLGLIALALALAVVAFALA